MEVVVVRLIGEDLVGLPPAQSQLITMTGEDLVSDSTTADDFFADLIACGVDADWAARIRDTRSQARWSKLPPVPRISETQVEVSFQTRSWVQQLRSREVFVFFSVYS
jgi:hypothetical protein